MKKKYFTDEERKNAHNLESKRYYDKIKKPPLSVEEKEILKQQRKKARQEYLKKYYLKNKEKIKNYSKEYFKENKEIKQKKHNDRYNERRKEDPIFKLATNIKRNLHNVLRKNGFTKKSRSYEILGCSYEEFKKHLESKFESWMNWDNYGKYNGEPNYGWDIDHVIPISSVASEEEVILLSHYTNLQPLCSYINRVIKRDHIITIKKTEHVSTISCK